MYGLFLLVLSCTGSFAQGSGTTADKPKPAPTSSSDTLDSLAASLSKAGSSQEVLLIETRMEMLRRTKITPATNLLLQRSERNLAAQKPDDAFEDLGDAMALQPEVTVLRRDRAAAALAAGRYDDAIADLGIYLQSDATDPTAWACLTEIETRRKDFNAAFNAWQHVLLLAPQTPDGSKRLEKLRAQAFGSPT